MAFAFSQLFQPLYDLFVNYLFGSIELTAIGFLIILGAIAYKLNVTADGWVIVLGGYGLIMGLVFIPSFAIGAITAIVIGVLIYALLKRFSR